MMRVLVAVDDSSFGKIIVDFVVNYLWPPGSKFMVVHAIEPTRALLAWPNAQILLSSQELVEDVAKRIEKKVGHGYVETRIVEGVPHKKILELAAEWPADLIVMGSHGKGDVARFLMGSVSTSVVMHAPCSVMIVRMPVGPKKGPGATAATRSSLVHG